MTLAHQEQKDLLRDVLGDGFRPAHLQGKTVNPALAAAVKKRQGFLVSGQASTVIIRYR